MFGFVKSGKEERPLGGDLYQEKKRKMNILFGVLGLIGFLILNIVLYYLTKI